MHIRPLLGAMKVAAVTSADVERFMDAVAIDKAAESASPGAGWQNRCVPNRGLVGRDLHLRCAPSLRPTTRCWCRAAGRRASRAAAVRSGVCQLGRCPTRPTGMANGRGRRAISGLDRMAEGRGRSARMARFDFARRTAVLPDSKTGRSFGLYRTPPSMSSGGCPGSAMGIPATRIPGQIAGLRSLWAHLIG